MLTTAGGGFDTMTAVAKPAFIAVVDDHAEIRELLARYLSEHAFDPPDA